MMLKDGLTHLTMIKWPFKSDHYVVYTEKVNKIALSSNDDKRLQTFDRITTYPHGTNAFKVCEREMMIVRDLFVESYAD